MRISNKLDMENKLPPLGSGASTASIVLDVPSISDEPEAASAVNLQSVAFSVSPP